MLQKVGLDAEDAGWPKVHAWGGSHGVSQDLGKRQT